VAELGDESERAIARLGEVVVAVLDEAHGACGVGAVRGEAHTMEHIRDGHLVALTVAQVLVEPVAEEVAAVETKEEGSSEQA
jgi:hypothetical protein